MDLRSKEKHIPETIINQSGFFSYMAALASSVANFQSLSMSSDCDERSESQRRSCSWR